MNTFLLRMFLACLILACGRGAPTGPEQMIAKRPPSGKAICDPVGLMTDMRESTERHLASIRTRYGIEILIVTLPSLENRYTIDEAAVELFSNWKIGKTCNGRGMLLLFVDDEKKIRLEVGYELEDVFTDAFTGHIQDAQLQPRYAAGQLAVGFIAVMEALESRAQVKFSGGYTAASIAALDSAFLSQGAGAGRSLKRYAQRLAGQDESVHWRVNTFYPAGETPAAAWQTLIRRWRDKVKDPFLGVYTPVTRLTYRDFTHLTDSTLEKYYATYAAKSYRVLQEGDFAVIDFGARPGWDNAPFLLCRTQEGWQFDIVHQRRYIRMGKAPHWGVEFSEHPYMPLLREGPHFNGQDIPVAEDDRYTIDRDKAIADGILACEARLDREPENLDAMVALGRLYTIAAMNQRAIPLLKRALEKDPASAAALKYLAIAHVDAYYQYETARTYLDAYVQRVPDDPFGFDFSGYLHYRKSAYQAAVDAFEGALAVAPDDCYAHHYLTLAYAGLYSQASVLNPRKPIYRERSAHHREETRACAGSHPIRVAGLSRWLGGQ